MATLSLAGRKGPVHRVEVCPTYAPAAVRAGARRDVVDVVVRIATAVGAPPMVPWNVHDLVPAKTTLCSAEGSQIDPSVEILEQAVFSAGKAARRFADARSRGGEVATRADQNLLPEQKKVSASEVTRLSWRR